MTAAARWTDLRERLAFVLAIAALPVIVWLVVRTEKLEQLGGWR